MQKEIEQQLAMLKPEISSKFKVSRIGYFGSYSRNEQTEHSDLDVLVEFSEPIGWEIFDLQDQLEQVLKIPVDLVTPNALKPFVKNDILAEVRYV